MHIAKFCNVIFFLFLFKKSRPLEVVEPGKEKGVFRYFHADVH